MKGRLTLQLEHLYGAATGKQVIAGTIISPVGIRTVSTAVLPAVLPLSGY